MPGQYQLTMRSGPNPGTVYALDADQISIGRDSSNRIPVNDAEVSRHHSRLSFQGGKYVLEDMGSTNGTFVNGQRLTGPRVLKSGEVVSLGEQIVFVYEAVDVRSGCNHGFTAQCAGGSSSCFCTARTATSLCRAGACQSA